MIYLVKKLAYLVPVFVFGLLSCVSDGQSGLETGDDLQEPINPALMRLLSDEDFVELTWDSNIKRGRLENGLSYFLLPNNEPENKIIFQLAVASGSIFEEEDQRGVAHFLEHMAFNGTADYEESELVSFLGSLGIDFGSDLNAFTSFDETVYFLEIPANDPELLEEGINVLSQWLYYISLEDDAVERERGVVLEEWRSGRGVFGRWSDFLYAHILGNTRYADRIPIGLPEVIETVTVQRIRDFYEQWYRPDLSAVTVVGNMDEATLLAVEQLIEQYFSLAPESHLSSSDPPVFDEPLNNSFELAVFDDAELSQTEIKLLLDRQAYDVSSPADYYQYIHEIILLQALNTRLSVLAEDPSAPFLAASISLFPLTKYHELYYASIAPKEDSKSGYIASLEVLYTEMERIRKGGLSEGEIDQQKSQIAQILTYLETNIDLRDSNQIAQGIGDAFLNNDFYVDPYQELEFYERALELANIDTINALTKYLLFLDSAKVLFSVPEIHGTSVPSEEEIVALRLALGNRQFDLQEREIIGIDQLLYDPPVDPSSGSSIQSEEEITELESLKWTLENGITVLYKRVQDPKDYIQIEGFKFGGISRLNNDDVLDARFLNVYLREAGLRGLSPSQLDQALSKTSASAELDFDTYDLRVWGDATIEDAADLFHLIHLHLSTYTESPEALSRVLQNHRNQLQNIENDPQNLFQRELTDVLVNSSIYERPIDLEDLNGINYENFRSLFVKLLGDVRKMTFVIVGDIEVEKVKELTEQYLASLNDQIAVYNETGLIESIVASNTPNQWIDRGVGPKEGSFDVVVEKGIDPIATLVLYFQNDVFYTWQNRVKAFVLKEILSNHLRNVIREELGLTYGVGVAMGFTYIPRNLAQSIISLQTDPEQVDLVEARVKEELQNIVSGIFPSDLLQNQKEIYKNYITEERDTNDFWLGFINGSYREFLAIDLDFHRLVDSMALVESLTDIDMIELARALLPFNSMITAKLIPE